MTTKEDWEFRAEYLNTAAKRLEREAANLMERAEDYRRQAKRADANAAALVSG